LNSDIPPEPLMVFTQILQVQGFSLNNTLFEVIAVIVLLLLCALVSASEVAYFSLSPKELDDIKNDDSSINDNILDLLEKPRTLLSTVLIAISFMSISIVMLTHLIIQQFFPESVVNVQIFNWEIKAHYIEESINIVLDICIILLFTEVMPKIFAGANKMLVATFMALPLKFLIKVFYPISFIMVKSSAFIEKKIRRYTDLNMDDIDQAIEMTADKDTTQEDIDVLKGIVHFGNITANQIMHPRMEIHGVDISWDFPKLLSYVRDSGYSRLPIYSKSLDHIEGVLHVKDLLPHINFDNYRWQQLGREAMFIPESKKIDDLLREIQEQRKHLAIVVDEHGGTSGLVTLEDIIEEVLGEIKDEFDVEEDFISSKVNNNTYVFEGKTLLNDVCKVLNADIDEFEDIRGGAESIAGLILELAGNMPEVKAEYQYQHYLFKVLSIEKRRIKRIQVMILDKN
jgi:gliding motility-associated protein GldE